MDKQYWNLSLSITAALGLSAGAYILYRKLKSQDGEEKTIVAGHQPYTTKELPIPKDFVPALIGKGGFRIKEIQEKTDTRVSFKDTESDAEHRICCIRGRVVDVQYAEVVIKKFMSEQATVETMEIWVPERACGMIIGRGGENIKQMAKQTATRITVERISSGDQSKAGLRKVIIKGPSEQLPFAKQLIEELLEKEQNQRKKVEERVSYRSNRRVAQSDEKISEAQQKVPDSREETLTASANDGYIDVFVSAVANPEQFWVQMVGPKAIELDELVVTMTDFYNVEENRAKYRIEKPEVGAIVVGVFGADSSYYRGRITSLNEVAKTAAVFFVDFGDSDDVSFEELFSMPADFLKLRFQAVECRLSGVRAKDGVWSSEAVESFSDLSLNAKWKPVYAKVTEYCSVPGRQNPIPAVELMNTQSVKDIRVSDELIRLGFAEPSA